MIGSDVYFGDLTLKDFHDYYIIHVMMNALKDPETPASCLEFNAGNSNFGDDLSGHDMPQSMDKKIRLNMVLGHQMINYYLLSAGMNPKTHATYHTGNGRIALTGQRHGFAAPVNIQGKTTKTFDAIKYANHLWQQHGQFLTEAKEVTSSLTLGFQLDQFMTDSMRHGTPIEPLKVDLTRHRTGVMWDTFLKQALMLHYTFDAIHLEAQTFIDPKVTPILVVATATYMKEDVQQTLKTYHMQGGKLMMFGAIPEYDYHGNPCTILKDYFNIQPESMVYDHESPLLSASYDKPIEGYHEFRTYMLQPLTHDADSIFHDLQGRKTSYITKDVIWITNNYPGHLHITQRMLDMMNVTPISHATQDGFVYIFKTQTKHGQYTHYFNMETYDVTIQEEGCPDVTVKALDTIMCPQELQIQDTTITATCELSSWDAHSFTFRTEGLPQTITLNGQFVENDACHQLGASFVCDIPRHLTQYWTIKKA